MKMMYDDSNDNVDNDNEYVIAYYVDNVELCKDKN